MQAHNKTASNKITLSMIVKNEEKYLRDCLNSAKEVVDEIVIVDTGSTDNTINIAQEFGAKIFNFEWINDFSAARNFSLEHSTCDWILYLDADERLSKKSFDEIKEITAKNDKAGIYCVVKSSNNISGSPSLMKYPRLFRNVKGIEFSGKVHEQIENSLTKFGFKLIDSNIEIIHLGYDVEANLIKEKAERNLKLLFSEYSDNPTAYNAFQLGQTLNILGNVDSANKYFKQSVEGSSLEIHHRAHAYRQLAAFELKNKNIEIANKYADTGLGLVESSPLLNVVKANILLELGQDKQAVDYCNKAFNSNSNLLTGASSSSFEITINESNMVLYGLNLAITAADREAFEFYYRKINYQQLSNEDRIIIDFYKKILDGEYLTKDETLIFLKFSAKIDFNILIKNLINYDKLESKAIIVDSILKLHGIDKIIRDKIYSVFYSEKSNNSIEFLESAYQYDSQNLEVGYYLLNAYLKNDKIEELKIFLNKAINSYSNFPEVVNKFKKIQTSLNSSVDDANR